MKNGKFLLLLAAVLAALVAGFWIKTAEAAEAAGWHFEWDYPTPPQDLAGFRIYQGGTLLADVTDKNARVYDHAYPAPVEVDDGVCFTITAYDALGEQSPPSDAFCVNLPPHKPTWIKVQRIAP